MFSRFLHQAGRKKNSRQDKQGGKTSNEVVSAPPPERKRFPSSCAVGPQPHPHPHLSLKEFKQTDSTAFQATAGEGGGGGGASKDKGGWGGGAALRFHQLFFLPFGLGDPAHDSVQP